MNEISTVTGLASSATLREFVEQAAPPAKSASAPAGDRVEISELAQFLSRVADLPDVRVEKVANARRSILRGDYETPAKLDHAIEKLLTDL
ncbi:MAG: flagellar biosynthesis anti-sigma factor FlgM [Phycisphaerae bacterium]